MWRFKRSSKKIFMTRLISPIGLICSALTISSVSGFSAGFDPAVITFGETSRDIGDQGPISENGYQYEAVGASWSLQDGHFPPELGLFPNGNALVTFWGIPPAVGNLTSFKRLDESPFLFLSVELRGRLDGQRNDVVMARGFLDGVEVASQVLQSSNEVWRIQLANSGFAAPVDVVQFELVESNDAALIFDNLVFAPVPEPGTCALLAIGLSALAWVRNRRVT